MGQKSITEDKNIKNAKNCNQLLTQCLKNDALIRFLLESLNNSQCQAIPTIKCIPCISNDVVDRTGYFDPPDAVNICQENTNSLWQMKDTLAHELIHAFDYCRSRFDMLNCKQRACTEIRAIALSGECKWSREVMRGHWKTFQKHHQGSLFAVKL